MVENVQVPNILILNAPIPPHDDRNWEQTYATLGKSRASWFVRLDNRMTMINDFTARMMEMELETQQDLKEMQTNT